MACKRPRVQVPSAPPHRGPACPWRPSWSCSGAEAEATDTASFEAPTVTRTPTGDGGSDGASGKNQAVGGGSRRRVLTVGPHRDVHQQPVEIVVRERRNLLIGV